MLKVFSLKNIGATALSVSMLLGALAASPVTSAFAKFNEPTTPYEDRHDASFRSVKIESKMSVVQPSLFVYKAYGYQVWGKAPIHSERR
jgi:hypothetical protein